MQCFFMRTTKTSAQSDPGPRWAHISENTFSYVAHMAIHNGEIIHVYGM